MNSKYAQTFPSTDPCRSRWNYNLLPSQGMLSKRRYLKYTWVQGSGDATEPPGLGVAYSTTVEPVINLALSHTFIACYYNPYFF